MTEETSPKNPYKSTLTPTSKTALQEANLRNRRWKNALIVFILTIAPLEWFLFTLHDLPLSPDGRLGPLLSTPEKEFVWLMFLIFGLAWLIAVVAFFVIVVKSRRTNDLER